MTYIQVSAEMVPRLNKLIKKVKRIVPSQTRMGNLFDGIGTTERLAIRNILLKAYVISLMYPYFAP